jgi:hypothetical protein
MNRPKAGASALPPARRPWPTGWLARLLAVAALLLAGAGLLVVAIAGFGNVVGQEFAPGTFQRRSFVYYQIPLLRIQISPVFRDNITSPLERYVSKQGFTAGPSKQASRWVIVRAVFAGSRRWSGDSEILCKYLDQRDQDGDYAWLKWSKEHPELAKCLWPKIAQAAQQDLYVMVPALFHLADTATDSDRLRQELSAHLADTYLRLANTHQQLEHHGRAVRYYTEALGQKTGWAVALRGRARSYLALGKPDLANLDLRRAGPLDAQGPP